jgi:hypothetical protein
LCQNKNESFFSGLRLISSRKKSGKEKMEEKKKGVPCLLWPFWAVWKLVIGILEITGRLIGFVLGLVLMILGIVLSLTVIGAILGVPIAIFGFLLMIRAIF